LSGSYEQLAARKIQLTLSISLCPLRRMALRKAETSSGHGVEGWGGVGGVGGWGGSLTPHTPHTPHTQKASYIRALRLT
jgi:hypothetical protein